ncbi:MAG: enoyl-CoA hydratase [Gammaproteobacteria bacterium]|uniref:3-hydroxyisobutyryl-CoA hydrolase n=1 Tax=OM182 bacterium MED-G24 TaxID=1986255 RepID=A0A2A5WNL9_9GAMM|nr:enoyl-CoA hydratase [Gammaproteobacteria bacterium]PDH37873.1 MAG: enoyl-CoA hydratase [OM182 bacterium MED-G24]|tara:strand:- start:3076 stop:4197 length:1122 start_codon:yes stop_codon:yes gene_type:complete
MSDVVLFEQGGVCGHIRLNSESTLNALSLDMIDLMYPRLLSWQDDDDIAFVLIDGAGDRAFCAGGDIQELYHSMVAHPGGPNPYAEGFFSREYRFDYLLHTYRKPVVVLGHGFVMGGGLGIFSAGSHRVATETTQMAMPEITIGLFPDAGGTALLSKMKAHHAAFMAWTGCRLKAEDGLEANLVDYVVSQADLDTLREALFALEGAQGDRTAVATRIAQVIDDVRTDDVIDSQLLRYDDVLLDLTRPMIEGTDDIGEATHHFSETFRLIETDEKWLVRARDSFFGGCAVTAIIIEQQLIRAREMDLAAMFRMEYDIASQCAYHSDFTEGVRALLIDKDNAPRWQFSNVSDVPSSHVLHHFEPTSSHPLEDLGR